MDTLLDFVELIIDVWKSSSFGVGMEKMLIAFLIFLSFAFVRGLFSRFVLQKMSSLAAKTETQMDDVMIVSLERPLKFFFLGFKVQPPRCLRAASALPPRVVRAVRASLGCIFFPPSFFIDIFSVLASIVAPKIDPKSRKKQKKMSLQI